jgi:hypothetical protein
MDPKANDRSKVAIRWDTSPGRKLTFLSWSLIGTTNRSGISEPRGVVAGLIPQARAAAAPFTPWIARKPAEAAVEDDSARQQQQQ